MKLTFRTSLFSISPNLCLRMIPTCASTLGSVSHVETFKSIILDGVGCGHNLRKILRHLRSFAAVLLLAILNAIHRLAAKDALDQPKNIPIMV